jgi:adenine deaminase
MMPSCVPATGMETSGATILPTDIHTYLQHYPNRVIGLAEMMNYPGVILEDTQVITKLITAGSRPKDGHAPLLSGKSLDAYIIAGLGSDHECTTAKEAREKFLLFYTYGIIIVSIFFKIVLGTTLLSCH